MTEEQYRVLDERVRKIENFILSQLSTLIELSKDLKERVIQLEHTDDAFKDMVNHSCTMKDKEIAKAKEEAIKISVEHANNNHKQTMEIINQSKTYAISLSVFLVSTVIGITVYFNSQNMDRAIASQRNATHIENITIVLDKIDSKIDRISDSISTHKKAEGM